MYIEKLDRLDLTLQQVIGTMRLEQQPNRTIDLSSTFGVDTDTVEKEKESKIFVQGENKKGENPACMHLDNASNKALHVRTFRRSVQYCDALTMQHDALSSPLHSAGRLLVDPNKPDKIYSLHCGWQCAVYSVAMPSIDAPAAIAAPVPQINPLRSSSSSLATLR